MRPGALYREGICFRPALRAVIPSDAALWLTRDLLLLQALPAVSEGRAIDLVGAYRYPHCIFGARLPPHGASACTPAFAKATAGSRAGLLHGAQTRKHLIAA
jgi:hypothetical protein